jgi:hypothetical protein
MVRFSLASQGQQLGNKKLTRRLRFGLVLAALLPGCVPMQANLRPDDHPPTGTPTEVEVVWKHEVCFAPDTVNSGSPVPSVVGRMYVFGGPKGSPIAADGTLLVRLFNEERTGPDGRAQFLGQWQIDSKSLAAMRAKDAIGWGYTLILPWSPYDPAITHVHLMVSYQPLQGSPLFHQSGPMVLHHPLVHSSSSQVVRGGMVPAQPPPVGTAAAGGGAR